MFYFLEKPEYYNSTKQEAFPKDPILLALLKYKMWQSQISPTEIPKIADGLVKRLKESEFNLAQKYLFQNIFGLHLKNYFLR